MGIQEIQAKSILRRHKKIDSWFVSRCGMNLYRGCLHACTYCDGRAEKYNVEGEFGRDVAVKVNAPAILERELDPARKRKPFKPGFLILGGGVGDSYQTVEKQYGLTRKALELLHRFQHPVHVLTKSTLVERDLDLIKKIDDQTSVIVSMSFSSVDDEISAEFEPNVPAPSLRLKTLVRFKREGLATGMFLLPVLPFVTDTAERIEASVHAAKEAGVDFVIFGGLTLKEGRQQSFFLERLREKYPHLTEPYVNLYPGHEWGQADGRYYDSIYATFHEVAKDLKMPKRIPPAFFRGVLDQNDLVVVLLEHIDYFLKSERRSSPFGYAALSISRLREPVASHKGKLQRLRGIGPYVEKVIHEILETGHASLYDRLSGA
jgi:DNA repair photolyase